MPQAARSRDSKVEGPKIRFDVILDWITGSHASIRLHSRIGQYVSKLQRWADIIVSSAIERLVFVKKIIWITLVLAQPPFIWAQQPFYTDDADVTPAGKVHLETFDEYDWLQHSQRPHRKQNTLNMRINYGLGNRLELDLDSPLIAIMNDTTASVRRPFGIGDTNFGMKYNIRPERGTSPALAVAAYIETPTGNSENGLGSGLTDIWVYGVVQKAVSPLLVLHLNGGYLFTGNTSTGVVGIGKARGHVATIGASIVRTFTRTLDVGMEVTGAVAPNTNLQRGQLQFLVGGNYSVHEGLTLDIGVLAGHYVASPRIGLQIGFSFNNRQ